MGLCKDCETLQGKGSDTPHHAALRFLERQQQGPCVALIFRCQTCEAHLGRFLQPASSGPSDWRVCKLPARTASTRPRGGQRTMKLV